MSASGLASSPVQKDGLVVLAVVPPELPNLGKRVTIVGGGCKASWRRSGAYLRINIVDQLKISRAGIYLSLKNDVYF